MNENKVLSNDEKLALVTKIIGEIELAGAREKDGFDVLMIISQLLFPGQAVDLRIYNPVSDC